MAKKQVRLVKAKDVLEGDEIKFNTRGSPRIVRTVEHTDDEVVIRTSYERRTYRPHESVLLIRLL